MTTLVIGARGHVGAAVLKGLVVAGEAVRASSRTPRPDEFPDAVEAVRADLTDPESFPGLLDGVRKVFLYANSDAPGPFAAAALRAGVEHVVLLSSNSVLFADAATNPLALAHRAVERAIEESGLAWTFVRPGFFATNTLRWRTIRTERIFRTAFPEGRTQLVHERDIADVAVEALMNDTHRQKSYMLLGSRPLTVREQIATIADALGEPVQLQEVDVATYRAELLTQLPEAVVTRSIQARGEIPQVPADLRVDAVPEVLGRPPLSFAEWVHDHAEDFR